MDDLGWPRTDYPQSKLIVFRYPGDSGLSVYFYENYKTEILIAADEDVSVNGVKTIDDLMAFEFYLLGTRYRSNEI